MKWALIGALMVGLSISGCGEEAPVDLRFVTPIATVRTMLGCYGVDELPQAEIDRRLELRRNFHLNDPAALRDCFVDWDEPSDEGLAGYVFGSVIVAKDDLIATIRDDEATVTMRDPEHRTRPIILTREDGGWRIVLERSVPRSVQADLVQKWEEQQAQ